MAFDLASISTGPGLRPPRIVVLGVEKIGKSTFSAGADSPIFIPMKGEEGIDALSVPQFPTASSVEEVLQAFGTLYTNQHDFKTIVLDSASAFEPIVHDYVCKTVGDKEGNPVDTIEKVLGGYFKGYGEAVRVWRKITEGLDALRNQRGMSSIIIGHVKVKRFDDPTGDSFDQYQFDIDYRAANYLFRWSDLILFANMKVVVKQEDVGFGKTTKRGLDNTGGQRFLYTQKHPAHPGGGRGVYGRLPYELPLSWQHFQDAVAAAANQSQEKV